MKYLRFLAPLLVLSLILAACAPASPAMPTTVPAPAATPMPEPTPEPEEEVLPETGPQTIVDIAVADGRFTTLVTAVQAAGLAETLSSDGPFTVFAPTDDAFAKLPEGTVEACSRTSPLLTDILLYHVVEGRVKAAQVVELEVGESISGAPFRVRVEDGRVFINDAQVIITDIFTSNGVDPCHRQRDPAPAGHC
jgi:transforming growth factor-beta-induced protein